MGVSCDWFDHGCNGGILTLSWIYLRFFGIVSDEFKPYTSGKGNVEWCPLLKSKCTAEGQSYKKYKAKNFYYLPTINQIKQNILEKGPIETGFLYILILWIINLEFTKRDLMPLCSEDMLLKLLDGEKKLILNIGLLLIPGLKNGEKKDISKSLLENVVLKMLLLETPCFKLFNLNLEKI